ncbi:transposase [Paraburkholderia sp. UCT70]
MIRTLLSDELWARIESVLPGKEGDPGRTASDNRWFVEAALWIGRAGYPCRDLPKAFGRWHTVNMRFSLRRRKGVWEPVIHAAADEPEIKHVLIDSAIVRAHAAHSFVAHLHRPEGAAEILKDWTRRAHGLMRWADRTCRCLCDSMSAFPVMSGFDRACRDSAEVLVQFLCGVKALDSSRLHVRHARLRSIA